MSNSLVGGTSTSSRVVIDDSLSGGFLNDSRSAGADSFAYKVKNTGYIVLVLPQGRSMDATKSLNTHLGHMNFADLQSITTDQLSSYLVEGFTDRSHVPADDDDEDTSTTPNPGKTLVDEEQGHGWVNFEVESTVFTAPRYEFQKYDFFKKLLDGQKKESDCIRLDGIAPSDFHSLLGLLYPWSTKKGKAKPQVSKRQWISVLRLSSILEITELRQLATESLYTLSLKEIEFIQLGKDFDANRLLHKGYSRLVLRDSYIRSSEVTKLGFETAVSIHRCREMLYGPYITKYHSDISPNLEPTHGLLSNLVNTEIPHDSPPILAVEKILTARSSGNRLSLMAAYEELVERAQWITLEEVEKLGVSAAESLWRARAALRKEYKDKVEKICNVTYPADTESIIQEVFGDELKTNIAPIDVHPDPNSSAPPEPQPIQGNDLSPPPLEPPPPVETNKSSTSTSAKAPKSKKQAKSRLVSWGPGTWDSSAIPWFLAAGAVCDFELEPSVPHPAPGPAPGESMATKKKGKWKKKAKEGPSE